MCLASEWGLVPTGQVNIYKLPNNLQKVKVPIVDKAKCTRTYNSFIDQNKICAGWPHNGKGACKGDSGGPLACVIEKRWVMVGCASFGSGSCPVPDKPIVYSYLPNYYDWIDKVRKS
ncbi:serine protease 30-like isoform X2 [Gigantopelta aegis]|nr:serine protease 30-like isoform X2 [Gigantopelta aegis]